MSRPIALVVGADPNRAPEIVRYLECDAGYAVRVAETGQELNRELKTDVPVFVLVDLEAVEAPEKVAVLDQLADEAHRAMGPVVAIVDRGYPRDWAGVLDSLVSATMQPPVDPLALARILQRLNGNGHGHVNGRWNGTCRVLQGETVQFVTYTPELTVTLDDLAVAAAHDVTALLVGETGTGKTYLARLMHEISPRRLEKFLPVACGALPADLIESELFGHVKGAFTGADRTKEGKFDAAAGGTLLLDEIDVLAPEQQAKLLRVIEAGEFEPVGSNETRKSNARLIVASNLDLETMIASNRFRADLYYRLKVLEFHIPPLRNRPRDIVPLALHFIDKFCTAHNIAINRVHPDFLAALKAYHWPGNVRQLENLICRSVLFCRTGELTAGDLPLALLQAQRLQAEGNGSRQPASALASRVELTERETIEQALRAHKNNRTAAARALGISRVGLYKKMKKYGLTHANGQSGNGRNGNGNGNGHGKSSTPQVEAPQAETGEPHESEAEIR